MKNPMGMMSMLGLMTASLLLNPTGSHMTQEDRDERQRLLDLKREPETEVERAKRLGLKRWDFQGVVVYAATRKKALKLAEKIRNKN